MLSLNLKMERIMEFLNQKIRDRKRDGSHPSLFEKIGVFYGRAKIYIKEL